MKKYSAICIVTSGTYVPLPGNYFSALLFTLNDPLPAMLTNNVQNYMQPANENQNDIQLLPTTLTATLHVCTLHKH